MVVDVLRRATPTPLHLGSGGLVALAGTSFAERAWVTVVVAPDADLRRRGVLAPSAACAETSVLLFDHAGGIGYALDDLYHAPRSLVFAASLHSGAGADREMEALREERRIAVVGTGRKSLARRCIEALHQTRGRMVTAVVDRFEWLDRETRAAIVSSAQRAELERVAWIVGVTSMNDDAQAADPLLAELRACADFMVAFDGPRPEPTLLRRRRGPQYAPLDRPGATMERSRAFGAL